MSATAMIQGETSSNTLIIHSETLNLNTDSVEWCPHENMENFYVVGSYQMNSQPQNNDNQTKDDQITPSNVQRKTGALYLYRLTHNNKDQEESDMSNDQIKNNLSVNHIQTKLLNNAGVLDIKWCRKVFNEKNIFAVADSNGFISLHSTQTNNHPNTKQNNNSNQDSNKDDKDQHQDQQNQKVEIINEISSISSSKSGISLSLDWDYEKSDKIISSDSKGFCSLINLHSSGLILSSNWRAHDFEAWITAFDFNNSNLIYSGSDDCLLKSWDLRSGFSRPTNINKCHTAGICAIHPSHLNDYILATGSYDCICRIWDIRKLSSDPLSSIEMGGGVWRLKWHPYLSNLLLAAVMHDGFHVFDYHNQTATISNHSDNNNTDPNNTNNISSSDDVHSLVNYSSYYHHGSLAYGCDWSFYKLSIKASIISTASFYDNMNSTWILKH